MEAFIKITQDLFPGDLSRLHLVELMLHVGGKFHVDNVVEALKHQVRHHDAKGRGRQALVLFNDIFAVLNGGDDGGIGGRSAHTALLHGFDQGCLRITGRRCGKVLFLLRVFGF